MKIIRVFVGALAIVSLGACVYVPETHARLECACPRNAPPSYLLSIQTPTGKWRLSGHGLAAYRETAQLAIRLPEQPGVRATYEAKHVAVLDDGYGQTPALVGGSVAVDREKRQVVLSLKTSQGDFWANGTYDLRSL